MAKTQSSCVVYWLKDLHCLCPWRHGYIGISTNWALRLKRHRTTRGRNSFYFEHLFWGSLKECMKLEQRLRPRPGIGWNEAAGGIHGGGKAPKKERTRTLMRLAALDRYTDPLERERTSRFVKEGLKDIDRRGSNNAHFGKPHSEEAKEKIRQRIKDRGGVAGGSNPMFGRKRTDEQRRAISEGTKRAIERAGGLTPDQRQRQAANTLRGDRHPKRRAKIPL